MKKSYFLLLWLLNILPAQAQYSMETYFSGYEKETPDERNGITEIYFVGTGDLQIGLTDRPAANKNIAANTGLGVLFWRVWPNGRELQLDAKISIASTVDTVFAETQNGAITNNRLFGRYALMPIGTGQATQVNALLYFDRTKTYSEYNALTNWQKCGHFISGIELSGAASNQVWAVPASTTTGGTAVALRAVNVSTLAWRLGAFHDFMPQELGRQKGYAIRLGLNTIGRVLRGDIGLETPAMQTMRTDFLGSKTTNYWGYELLLGLRLKNIRAEAALPHLFQGGGESVPGLTGAQFVTSISFVGGFPLNIGGANNTKKPTPGQ
jgi:hypothetical protein